MARGKAFMIGGKRVRPGETRDLRLTVTQTFTGDAQALPVRIIRAKEPGPVVFLTAAVHGDEINGTGIIRELIFDKPPELTNGALVCVPVVDISGFENHNRYMPDRRDLNRCFPGSDRGSLASRYAHFLMKEIVAKCDYGIDLHSAAAMRTNLPNVRGDLRIKGVRGMARAFGCEIIINSKGPEGSLRRTACAQGCPTIILEAGEPGKFEPVVMEIGVRGIVNVLKHLGMMEGTIMKPPYQTRVKKTKWVRAELGGLLRFHVAPGDVVSAGDPIASNESVFGQARSVLIAPVSGIILGITTHPAVQPGEPVCHIAVPDRDVGEIRRALQKVSSNSPESRIRQHLATNIAVSRVNTGDAS